jgi:citrate synthase
LTEWLSAAEALDRLGLKPQTLYAYVSRGLLAARPDPEDSRRSLYRAREVEILVERRRRSRRPSDVAVGAMAFGEPVLSSAITTVHAGRHWYRGRDAIALADTETLESVARLLSGGDGVTLKRSDRPAPPTEGSPLARAFLALAARAAQAPPALGQPVIARSAEAAVLLDIFADALVAETEPGPIHLRLARAWRLGPGLGPGGQGADLIRRTLVLLADHELNPSAFAARVAASTGASLAASALAGLAALSGPRHGGAPAALAQFRDEAHRLGPGAAVAGRLTESRSLPGFGHPLYPEGDPRASALLLRFQAAKDLQVLADQVRATTGQEPNIDFALVALCDHLDAPEGSALSLFAVARCAGWLAHALEQIQDGGLIRPRARYTGDIFDQEPAA